MGSGGTTAGAAAVGVIAPAEAGGGTAITGTGEAFGAGGLTTGDGVWPASVWLGWFCANDSDESNKSEAAARFFMGKPYATTLSLRRQLCVNRENYSRRARARRRALPITETELTLMAALAIIGLKSTPNTG